MSDFSGKQCRSNAPTNVFPLGEGGGMAGIPWGIDCQKVTALWNLIGA